MDNSAAITKTGDAAIDIEEGRTANCGLLLGISTAEKIASVQPCHVLDTLSDLPALLKY